MSEHTGRANIVSRLRTDLIGPYNETETLRSRPSDVYLTGILWPQRQTMAGQDDDRMFSGGAGAPSEPAASEEEIPANSMQKPSVAGLSFSVRGDPGYEPAVSITVRGAIYAQVDEDGSAAWQHQPFSGTLDSVPLRLGSHRLDTSEADLPPGLQVFVRAVSTTDATLTTVSVVNGLPPGEDRDSVESATIFQMSIEVTPADGTRLVPRPSGTASTEEVVAGEWSEPASNVLLFRNVREYATGHVCSATWAEENEDAPGQWSVPAVSTVWLPTSVVPGVDGSGHECFRSDGKTLRPSLDADALAGMSADGIGAALSGLCDGYAAWIDLQREKLGQSTFPQEHASAAQTNVTRCQETLDRMRDAVAEIQKDEQVLRAFRLANRAMALQHSWDPDKGTTPLVWRPFQLGFLLLTGISTIRREHEDRKIADLLWFPTGGGKTEAYLLLIAFVAFMRRLSSGGGGMVALMRYTLRLLTTQQFVRASSMILACEVVRRAEPAELGEEPFSIGLWVGGDATPNNRRDAWASRQGDQVASPEQLAVCPKCRSPIRWTQANARSRVIASCSTSGCELEGNLPVHTVDEDVYETRPTLLIGTIDKFAQIVRRRETGDLFGVGTGLAPDLIVQDELHLISGPLGTIAGLYEAAFDLMFENDGCPPKVVGSTATIRRAGDQVRALFDRDARQFPPPGIDHDDSGFAVPKENDPGRRYVGVTTAGRSAKFTLQAVSASLLQSAQAAFVSDVERDPYWTLVGYFNSLRELGGALVLMQDDVTDSVRLIANARGETDPRPIGNVEELTSRRTQDEILEMLDLLATKVGQDGAVDTVLATNMVSVGVDIPRLGLMVVNGQPKTISEYIQATSRVGRGGAAGLVVSVLNNAKTRDRSRYETFCGWHLALYRDVEATSVTPFASRARDRALHAALVAAVRHLVPGMDAEPSPLPGNNAVQDIITRIRARAHDLDPSETDVGHELARFAEKWDERAPQQYWNDYQPAGSLLQSAERAARRRSLNQTAGAAQPTMNSMRSVETGTMFRMAPALRGANDGEE